MGHGGGLGQAGGARREYVIAALAKLDVTRVRRVNRGLVTSFHIEISIRSGAVAISLPIQLDCRWQACGDFVNGSLAFAAHNDNSGINQAQAMK